MKLYRSGNWVINYFLLIYQNLCYYYHWRLFIKYSQISCLNKLFTIHLIIQRIIIGIYQLLKFYFPVTVDPIYFSLYMTRIYWLILMFIAQYLYSIQFIIN